MNDYIIKFSKILTSILTKKPIDDLEIIDYVNIIKDSLNETGVKIISSTPEDNIFGYCILDNNSKISPHNFYGKKYISDISKIIDSYNDGNITVPKNRKKLISPIDNSKLNMSHVYGCGSVKYNDEIEVLCNMIFYITKYKLSITSKTKIKGKEFTIPSLLLPIFDNDDDLKDFIKKIIIKINSSQSDILVKKRKFDNDNKEKFYAIRSNFLTNSDLKNNVSSPKIDNLKPLLPYYITQIIRDMDIKKVPNTYLFLNNNGDYHVKKINSFILKLSKNNLIFGIINPIVNNLDYENIDSFRIRSLFDSNNITEFINIFNRLDINYKFKKDILYKTIIKIFKMENKNLEIKMLEKSSALLKSIWGVTKSENKNLPIDSLSSLVDKQITKLLTRLTKIETVNDFIDYLGFIRSLNISSLFTKDEIIELYNYENNHDSIGSLISAFKAGLITKYNKS